MGVGAKVRPRQQGVPRDVWAEPGPMAMSCPSHPLGHLKQTRDITPVTRQTRELAASIRRRAGKHFLTVADPG